MAEEASDAMNLDLNLGFSPEAELGTTPGDLVNLNEWVDDRIRQAVRLRARQRRRWRQDDLPHDPGTLSVDLGTFLSDSGVNVLQSGEGSVTAEERIEEEPKMCENNNGFIKDEASEEDGGVEKGRGDDGNFFDCNICFDLATDPVVTCCGHLFCWPCLYLWLHVHSESKECPVCKGEVNTKNLIPIYGRGNNNHKLVDSTRLEIPVRPHARRVESFRQTIQRNPFSFPLEEMIQRLGSRLDLIGDLSTSPDANGTNETADRPAAFLNRIRTTRAMRSLQNPHEPPNDTAELTDSGSFYQLARQARRFQSLLIRSRSQSHSNGSSAHASFSTALSSAERPAVYTRRNPVGRNQEQAQPVDDRDSFSSIAAVINSGSQMDTAMEIDSMVSLSTSSSRRRPDASRGSDVDSGDSHPPRRRRLN